MIAAIDSSHPGERLLVFGSGFIASHLALDASRLWGWNVDVVYRQYHNPALVGLSCHALPPSFDELQALIAEIDPTYVVIASGSSFVPAINRDIDAAMDQHLNLSLLFLDALARLRSPSLKKILTIGSASEYGVFPDHAVDETHATQPRDAYGLMKLAQRQIGRYFGQRHDLPVVHVRQFNVTGVEQDQRFVLPSICRQVAQLKNTLPPGSTAQLVAGNIAVRRDFLAIEDVCEAYRFLLLHGKGCEIYNVCSGVAVSINELIATAGRISGLKLAVDVSPELMRENDKAQPVILGDSSKLQALGWAPKIPLPLLLERMITYYATLSIG